MVAIVLGIIALSVVAVLSSYAPAVRAGPPGRSVGLVIALALFLASVAAAVAAYLACVGVGPGYVPAEWHPFETDEVCVREREREREEEEAEEGWGKGGAAPVFFSEHPPSPPLFPSRFPSPHQQAESELARLLAAPPPPSARALGAGPRPRWCKKCKAWKPDRAHHCSVAGRCVLRMDHYCVWVVNTVGLLNYKVRRWGGG